MRNDKEKIDGILIKYVSDFYKKFGFFDIRIISNWKDILIDDTVYSNYYPSRMSLLNAVKHNYILYVSRHSNSRNLRYLNRDLNFIKERINSVLFNSQEIIASVKIDDILNDK